MTEEEEMHLRAVSTCNRVHQVMVVGMQNGISLKAAPTL